MQQAKLPGNERFQVHSANLLVISHNIKHGAEFSLLLHACDRT
jgi:hypothetical protein